MIGQQTFQPHDIGIIAFLVLLEGLLSADNALVLALLVKHLPTEQRNRALLYGLGGAFVFRFIAILFATYIIQLWWLQLIGAVYLLYLPFKHFREKATREDEVGESVAGKGFWPTVVQVELTDIAFGVDSVLAGVAVVHNPSKLWVVFFGAAIGIVLLRVAARVFTGLLERYPQLDDLAYALVAWVGVKLLFASMQLMQSTTGNYQPVRIGHIPDVVYWPIMGLLIVGGTWRAVKQPALKANEEPVIDDVYEVLAEPEAPRA